MKELKSCQLRQGRLLMEHFGRRKSKNSDWDMLN